MVVSGAQEGGGSSQGLSGLVSEMAHHHFCPSFWPKKGIRSAPVQGEMYFTSRWELRGGQLGPFLQSGYTAGEHLFITKGPLFLGEMPDAGPQEELYQVSLE